MKIATLISAFIFSISAFAQTSGDIVFYSHTGKKFYVILNGIKQNPTAETNVKIKAIESNWYGCKIIGENNDFEVDKNIIVKRDTLITYKVVDKKGKYKLHYFSEVPMSSVTQDNTQSVIAYHSTVLPTSSVGTQTTVTSTEVISNQTTNASSANTGETIAVDMNASGTTINSGSDNTESVNISIQLNENGMSTNISATGDGIQDNMSSSTNSSQTGNNNGAFQEESTTSYSETINGNTVYSETTTITTTTTTSTGSNNLNQNWGDANTNQVSVNASTTYNSLDYTECLVDQSGMKTIVEAVQNESFADDQLRVAKQIAKKKCLTVDQIKQITSLFSFSNEQVEFTKYAYNTCINKSDYYQVMDVFTFSADKEELEEFLNSK